MEMNSPDELIRKDRNNFVQHTLYEVIRIILEAAKEAVEWQRKLSEKQDTEFWDKIKETKKIKVTVVDRKPFENATKSVYKQIV